MTRSPFLRITFFVFLFSRTTSIYSQILDPSFGSSGHSVFYGARSSVLGMTTQTDNKILTTVEVTNYSSATDWLTEIARFNTDGSIDSSYGTAGVAQVNSLTGDNSSSYDIDLQSDGKCISGGSSVYCSQQLCGEDNLLIFRLTTSGQFDSTFGIAGYVKVNDILPGTIAKSQIYRIVVLPNDKILIGGTCLLGPSYNWASNVFVARLNSNGTPDLSFGSSGLGSTLFGALNFLSAPDFALDAFNNIFLTGGMAHIGDSNLYAYVIKLDNNGIVDNNFGVNGTVEFSFGYQTSPLAIGVRSDNKLIISGYFVRNYYSSFSMDTVFVAILEPNGGLSTTIPGGYRLLDLGMPAAQVRDLEMLSDDRFLITGIRKDTTWQGDTFVGRLNQDGSPDSTFSGDGRAIVISEFQFGSSLNRVMQLPNCQVLTGGSFNNVNGVFSLLVRINSFNCPLISNTVDQVAQNEITLFPNPSNGQVYLQITKAVNELSIQMVDLQGRIVVEQTQENVASGINELNFNCQPGVYFLLMTADGIPQTQKLILGY